MTEVGLAIDSDRENNDVSTGRVPFFQAIRSLKRLDYPLSRLTRGIGDAARGDSKSPERKYFTTTSLQRVRRSHPSSVTVWLPALAIAWDY